MGKSDNSVSYEEFVEHDISERFNIINYEEFIQNIGHEKVYSKTSELTIKDFMPDMFEKLWKDSQNPLYILNTENSVYFVFHSWTFDGWDFIVVNR